MMHHHKNSGNSLFAFIAGAATALALGGYFLYGPHGRENRKKLDRWVLRAKIDILDKMESVEDLTEEQYRNIVDEVTNRYASLKHVGQEKAARAGESFKRRWNEMRDAARRARGEAEVELAQEELERERNW